MGRKQATVILIQCEVKPSAAKGARAHAAWCAAGTCRVLTKSHGLCFASACMAGPPSDPRAEIPSQRQAIKLGERPSRGRWTDVAEACHPCRYLADTSSGSLARALRRVPPYLTFTFSSLCGYGRIEGRRGEQDGKDERQRRRERRRRRRRQNNTLISDCGGRVLTPVLPP